MQFLSNEINTFLEDGRTPASPYRRKWRGDTPPWVLLREAALLGCVLRFYPPQTYNPANVLALLFSARAFEVNGCVGFKQSFCSSSVSFDIFGKPREMSHTWTPSKITQCFHFATSGSKYVKWEFRDKSEQIDKTNRPSVKLLGYSVNIASVVCTTVKNITSI